MSLDGKDYDMVKKIKDNQVEGLNAIIKALNSIDNRLARLENRLARLEKKKETTEIVDRIF